MKPLHRFSITKDIRTYAALYTLDMEATMSYYFSQQNECDYVSFRKVENDIIRVSTDAMHATHHNQ